MRAYFFLRLLLAAALCPCAAQKAAAQAVSAPLQNRAGAPNQQSRALSSYDSKLVRMAEVLGSLHYLYNLCGQDAGSGSGSAGGAGGAAQNQMLWRDYMQKLLSALHSDAMQNARLYAAFNRSYQAFAGTYGSCTAAAREVLARYRLEGQNLSRLLLENFGSEAF